MTEFPALLRSVIAGNDLSAEDAAWVIGGIMDETISPVRTGALFAALAAKGESATEIVGAARAMRERCVRVEHGLPLVLDIVGTGGDGHSTINLSTTAALVVAGCGIPVAKHGNRAASSKCGSADVLEVLGVQIENDPEVSARLLRDSCIAFLYARRHHPATRAVGPVRTELGVRTIFNILGPLTNPAAANRQVVGVAQEKHLVLLAEALQELGSEAGAVVHSASGLDEVAGDGPTAVVQFDAAGIRRWTLNPADYGVHAPLETILGDDATFNAAALLAILAGERSPRADLVALNAALALVVAGVAETIDDGMERARASIASGAAQRALDAFVARGPQGGRKLNDMLDKLYAATAVVRAADLARESIEVVRERAATRASERRPFRAALLTGEAPAIIAEIKRASPSVGLIVRELDPAAIARAYEAAGANAISVLTEADHFLGDLAYVDIARKACNLPILRKDFMRTRYDVAQSAAYGADCVLAIVAGLSDAELTDMFDEAKRYALDVLVEVHDEEELSRAIQLGATLLGINNRDLRTFETNLAVTAELLPLVPSSIVVISESGVRSREDVQPLFAAGARGFLIGESLMRTSEKAEMIRALRGGGVRIAVRTRVKICGCTSIADVEGAVEAGADAVGVIFAASPRKVSLANARAIVQSVPSFVAVVGVMVNPDETFVDDVLSLGMVPQFSGDESPEFCADWANGRYVKALHFVSGTDYTRADAEAAADRYPGADLLFDSRSGALYGGTGTTFSWPLVEGIARRRRIIVGGGLSPENVADAVRGVRPFGVDVRSGVESDDKKDAKKMRAFVRAVREADEGTTLAKT